MAPMPDTMKAEIMEGIHFLSEKENLETFIRDIKAEERKAFFRIISSYCHDTLIPNPLDSLKNLFDNDHYLSSRYQLAFCYLKSGETASVDTILAEITTSFNLSSTEQTIHQYYTDLFGILNQLDSVNIYPWYMNSTYAFLLEELAQNDAILPGALARNMLLAAGEKDYKEKLIFPVDSLKSTFAEEKNDNKFLSDKEKTCWIRFIQIRQMIIM